jgi:hypothetical protein
MQGAQKLRSEAYLRVRCNDEGEAHRSRWTFYETINFQREGITAWVRTPLPFYDFDLFTSKAKDRIFLFFYRAPRSLAIS